VLIEVDGIGYDIPPFSIPLTAASDTVRSTDFRVSLAASVAVFWAGKVVEKRRVRVRGMAFRGMMRRKDISAALEAFLDICVKYIVQWQWWIASACEEEMAL
jgi:hypothetical protein